jgi:UDP-glucose 4-epimerase
MKFLVTGGAGFIGRWVVKDLLDRDHDVVALDDLSNGNKEDIAEFRDNQAFEFVQTDVKDEEALKEVFEQNFDKVIHLAAKIDVQESLDNPREHFEDNIIGTEKVLELCRKNDVGLTLVGTCMVYDMADSEEGIDEEHPVEPASPYAGTKLAAENLAESYYHGYDLPVTIVRPFNTYGPFQKTGMAGGVVSIFTDRDIENKDLKIFGDGEQTRDLMYVTDTADFIVEATLSEEADGEIINAGTGRDISINDLAELIATEGTEINHVEHHHPQSEVQKLLCDPSKARELLDWEPEVSLEEGVQNLREWMKERKDE